MMPPKSPSPAWYRPFAKAIASDIVPEILVGMDEIASLVITAGKTDEEIESIVRDILEAVGESLKAGFQTHCVDKLLVDLQLQCFSKIRKMQERLVPSGRA